MTPHETTVVYVVGRFPTFSQTFVIEEVRALLARGLDVRIVSLEPPSEQDRAQSGAAELSQRCYVLALRLRNTPVLALALLKNLARAPGATLGVIATAIWWTLLERHPRHLLALAEAIALRERLPPHASHLHSHFAHRPTTVAMLLARLSGLPFSFTGHAVDIFQLTHRRVLAEKVAGAKFVVLVSEHARDWMTGIVPVADHAKLQVIRNGLDRGRYSARSVGPTGVPMFLTVSRFVPKKGLDTFVEAAGILAQRDRVYRCELVGDGPQEAQLLEMTRRLALGGSLRFRGALPQEEVRRLYERATAFVLPCRRLASGDQDGLPVVITEALAIGVPVVSTRVSGIPEVVRDDQSGILVRPDAPVELADALERLLDDRELGARLGRGAVQAVKDFDSARSAAKLDALIRSSV